MERAVRSDAAAPSLLAGLLRDEDGIPLTPTHANKKGRRYRYYVSHDLITGRKSRGDDAEGGPQRRRSSARRIPATDLEAIVQGRITELFADASAMDTIVAPRTRDVEERRALAARSSDLAHRWPDLPPSEKITSLHLMVEEIVVTANAVNITIRSDAILAMLRGETAPHQDVDCETLTLSVPATLKRVGMEMRHLIDAPQAHQNRKPDRSLLRLLARAQKFRDLILQGDGTSITELAAASAVTPSYFTRIVRLSFLAPDITAAILDGRQPLELSALKLSLANLPRDWSEQRREFGFG